MPTTRDPLERVQAIREDRKSSRRRFLGAAAVSAAVLGGVKLPQAQSAAAQQFRPTTRKGFAFGSPIQFVDGRPSVPYDTAFINVTGLRGTIEGIRVGLFGLTHTDLADLNVLLRSPNGRYLMLLSDVGDETQVSGVDLVFASGISNPLPAAGPIQPGTYSATNHIVSGVSDFMPFPAQPPNITTMDQLTGLGADQAVGPWFLYTYDKKNGDGGSLQNWTLEFVTSNRGPVAPNLNFKVRQGTTLRVPRSQVLKSVRDADGDRLTFSPINERTRVGRMTLKQNGSFTFVARPNRTGRARFRYYVTDGEAVATGRIIIQVTPR